MPLAPAGALTHSHMCATRTPHHSPNADACYVVKQAPHDLQKENRSSSDDEHARAKAAAPSPAPPQPPAHAAPLAAAARAAEPGPEPATPAAAAAGGKEAAAGAGGAGAAGGRDLVGRRVSIFWPKEQAWFDGEIDDADEDGRHHGV